MKVSFNKDKAIEGPFKPFKRNQSSKYTDTDVTAEDLHYVQVSRYEVRREGGGNVSSFLASEGRIVLELGREANLEMRVQYSGHQGWSNWQWVAADALVMMA